MLLLASLLPPQLTDHLPLPLSQAGRIPSLDTLASLYLSPTATRPDLLASASALAASITGPTSELAAYYIKVMSKWVGETAPEAEAWIEKEKVRLGKLASRKGAIAGKKLDELKMKQNVSFGRWWFSLFHHLPSSPRPPLLRLSLSPLFLSLADSSYSRFFRSSPHSSTSRRRPPK